MFLNKKRMINIEKKKWQQELRLVIHVMKIFQLDWMVWIHVHILHVIQQASYDVSSDELELELVVLPRA